MSSARGHLTGCGQLDPEAEALLEGHVVRLEERVAALTTRLTPGGA